MYCWNINCRGFTLNNFTTGCVCVNDSNNQGGRKLNCVLTIPHYWITVRIYFLWCFLDEGNKINLRDVIPTFLGEDMILLQSELMHFLDVSSAEKFSGPIKKTSILPELRWEEIWGHPFFTDNKASPDVGEAVQVVRLDKKSTAVYHQHINGKKWLWSSTRVTLVKKTEMVQWLSLDWLHIRLMRIRTEVSDI